MNKIIHTCFLMFICMTMIFNTNAKKDIKINDAAPDFTLKNEMDTSLSLSQFRGKKVVLMFYPSIKTPHCSKEVCNISNNFERLKSKNVIVLGISYNNPSTNKKFIKNNKISFPLLSDSNKHVTKLYNVYGWFFPKRRTFLIDEQGIILHIIKTVDIKNHVQQIIDAFKL